MGQITPVMNPAPLILDKWSANAFLVLGREVCAEYPWERLYDLEPLASGEPAILRQNRVSGDLYRLYIAWFNRWAEVIGITAESLELYVFGMSRKGFSGRLLSNPRNAIVAVGKRLFF